MCLCGRRGDPGRTTSGSVFPGALWLLPLLSVVREWDPSSPATLHPLLAAPTDWYLDPPVVRTFSHVAADGGKTSSFFFFFWHRRIFLDWFFYFGGQRGAAVLRKWWGIFRTQNTTVLRNRAGRKKHVIDMSKFPVSHSKAGAIYQAGEDDWLVIWHLINVSSLYNWYHQANQQVSFNIFVVNVKPDFSLKRQHWVV